VAQFRREEREREREGEREREREREREKERESSYLQLCGNSCDCVHVEW